MNIRRLGLILFATLLLIYISFLFLFLYSIRLYIMLELIASYPILLPMAIMYYYVVDTLTPNPKHPAIYGWLYAEFLEHIIFPLTIILVLTLLPQLSMLAFIFLIYYFYGNILGTVKQMRDVISLCTLIICFMTLSFYTDIVFFINAETFLGWIFIVVSLMAVTFVYFVFNMYKNRNKQNFLNFIKAYSLLILSVIASIFVSMSIS